MGLFNLIFRLGTDNTDFNKGLGQARRSMDQAASGMSASLKRNFAAAFSIGSLSAAAKKTIDYASHIDDLSKASGIARETIQEFDYAMRQNGATIDDAIKGARELSKARAEALADPQGPKARLFEQFGIGPNELKNLSNGGDLLKRLSDALKGVNVDANSLPAILDLIGAKNQVIIPAMIDGLREAGDEARRLGLLLDDATVKSLDAAGDAATRFGQRMTTAWAKPLALTAEALNKIGHGVDYFAAGVTGAWFELFQGKADPRGFRGYMDRIRFGFGAAASDEANRTQEEMAAAEAAAAKRAKAGQFDFAGAAGAREQNELERIRGQIAAAQRAAHFAGLTPEQRRAELEAELDTARKAKRNFGLDDRPPLAEANIDLGIARGEEALAQFIAQTQKPKLRALLKPAGGDQLTSIGNFLGSDPNAASEKKLHDIDERLKRIEGHASTIARKTLLLD
ncbi:MAG TPA: hypothetical protein VFT34_17450 [Verrucomicrobiae bacterium]|nr:hypothetical protein [Verrucomicrobiae bacterium]